MITLLEGIDAAGKTYHAHRLAERLGAKLFEFPNYNSATGQLILAHLQKRWCADWLVEISGGASDSNLPRAVARAEGYSKGYETGLAVGQKAAGEQGYRAAEKVGQAEEISGGALLVSDSNLPRAERDSRPKDKILDALVFQALQTINRLEVVADIEDAAAMGDVVLARYWPSAYVYGALDGLQHEWLLKIHQTLPQADLNILIDIPVEESFKRRTAEKRDRYEMDQGFMEKVAQLYRALWAQHPYTGLGAREMWEIIDGVGTKDEVALRIDGLVEGSSVL